MVSFYEKVLKIRGNIPNQGRLGHKEGWEIANRSVLTDLEGRLERKRDPLLTGT